MDQQKQTLDYFKSHAREWNDQASQKTDLNTYSTIENRHNGVFEVMKNYPSGSALLDVGCGTGQLVIEASQRGWTSLGVDFAKEMIEISEKNNKESKAHAKFKCDSIFKVDLESENFDVISAQGFIEYISLEQLDEFLDIAHNALKKGGAIALGSRNRLFNMHSLNEFSDLERALGTLDKLITESIILQSAKTQTEALNSLSALRYTYEQPTKHPLTGVLVETRYQFSPADLASKLAQHSFAPKNIFPVHFHPLPISMLSEEVPSLIHNHLAQLVSETFIRSHKFVPLSSSFVIEATKI